MRWFLTLAIVSVLVAACSASTPTQTPSPTVDLEATIDAAVEATRTVERAVAATVDASVEATRAAAPTATPVVMTIYAPTPEPYVAPPGSMEQGIEEMHRCLQESEEFRALFVAGIEQEGLSREAADDYAQAMLEDEEFFAEAMLEAADVDPAYASMLALSGELAGELCGPVVQPHGQDLGASDSEVEVLLGEFFDCYHSDPEIQAFMEASFKGDTGAGFFDALMSNRELFVGSVLAGVRQDPNAAADIEGLGVFVEAFCR